MATNTKRVILFAIGIFHCKELFNDFRTPIPPFLHGWIIDCDNDITYLKQIEIEIALSIEEVHRQEDCLNC